MAHQYAGANSFPVDYTCPDDLDDCKAASFNVALEALGDRTTYVKTLAVAETARALAVEATIRSCYLMADLISVSATSSIVSVPALGSQVVSLLASGAVPTLVGDIVEVLYSNSYVAPSGAAWKIEMQADQNAGGLVTIPGSLQNVDLTGSGSEIAPITSGGIFTVTTAGTLGISVKFTNNAIGGANINDSLASGGHFAFAKIWRKV